ncbi:MAG: ligase [Pseudomonadota bacterium]|jgi:protocatechuate 4,5-dioxygenase alpha chain
MQTPDFSDIPGTVMFDAARARQGYALNAFCMSLMQAANRERFKADEATYLEQWPMSPAQKQAVLARDMNRCLELGGNVFFLVKIAATDGISVQQMVAGMVGMSPQDYRDMMMQGGRPIQGNRSRREWGL